MDGYRVIRQWDDLPPVVSDQGEYFSTRVLEWKHRKMKEALESISSQGLDARQCKILADETLKQIEQ